MENQETKEVVKETVSSAENQPIINTNAVKEKANNLLGKAKEGINYYKGNIKNDRNLQIGTGVVVLVLVLLFALVFINPAKAVVKKYAKAMVNYDAKAIVEITHEGQIDVIEKVYDDYEEMLEKGFETLEDADYEYKSFKIDGDYKKYDKDDVEEMAEEWEEAYDIDEKDVQAVRRYTVEFKVDDDGDEDKEKVKVLVAKIDGKWYFMGEE